MDEDLKVILSRIVNRIMRRVDYHALYPATVDRDNGDNTVDVTVDDPRFGALVKVRMRVFLPGAKVKVKKGARVLLGFNRGKPSEPRVDLWEAGDLEELTLPATLIKLGGDDAVPVALQPQTDERLTKLETVVGATILALGSAPGGTVPAAFVAMMPFVAGGTPPGGTTGATKVKGK